MAVDRTPRGHWAEDEWRSRPRPVRDSLEGLARRLGAPTASALGAVFSRWEEAVGPTIAAHARPVSLTDGVLVVAVDQPGWATQLRYLSTDLLRQEPVREDYVSSATELTGFSVLPRVCSGCIDH